MTALTQLPLATTDWGGAILGLAGVLLGGVITTGGTILLKRKEDKRARESERRARGATIHILHACLEELRGYLRALEENGTWQANRDDEWLAIWQEHRRELAGFVDQKAYESVARAFLVARLLDWKSSSQGEQISGEDRKQLANSLTRLNQGVSTLDGVGPGSETGTRPGRRPRSWRRLWP